MKHFSNYWELYLLIATPHIPQSRRTQVQGISKEETQKNINILQIYPFKAQWVLYVSPAVTLKTAISHSIYLYEFPMILWMNNDYFPKQH
jgi:hypothetical protein